MNLRVLTPSRKAPQAGDVFAFQLPDLTYRFGRVIRTDATWTLAQGADGAVLIYIYRTQSREMAVPDRDELRRDHLLVPPMMTNRLPWSRGYFQTVGNVPLDEHDLLPRHCFLSAARGRYFDDYGQPLAGPIEPVGDYGLHSFRTIDAAVSDALLIPRTPN
ncbi:hypothetical protein F0U47_20305 [Nocardioides antri]|uniref:Immunity protein 26 n=2 Tax=Nocardioides antri TaxID=2607659 RepID=A0A5B1LRX2_9ACTN|nr:hypothetical protein F0U47_20305 [Nocardioides antri]